MMEQNGEGCAEKITAIAYKEETRCLDYRVMASSISDAIAAVKAIGQYNEFDPSKVIEGLKEVNKKYPKIAVQIGRESSPVIYLKWLNFTGIMDVNANEVKGMMAETRPDECDSDEFGMRLWWD